MKKTKKFAQTSFKGGGGGGGLKAVAEMSAKNVIYFGRLPLVL